MIARPAVEARGLPVDIQRHAFRAMGTDIEILLDAEPGTESVDAIQEAEREIRRLEALLSRFRGDSEVSILNRRGSLVASPDLITVVDLALAGRSFTGGRFDPTIHDAVVAAGYDRTFEELPPDRDDDEGRSDVRPGGGRLEVDLERQTIRLELGVRIDLGGIGKGYAVDRACDILDATAPCLVNAGGDLAVRGTLRGEPWPVGVEVPEGSITLGLEDGAVATSGRDRRRWLKGGKERHHLIDPSTGLPAETDLIRVTVVAANAAMGEIYATALFIAGEAQARREADELGIPSVLVTGDGRAVLAGGLA